MKNILTEIYRNNLTRVLKDYPSLQEGAHPDNSIGICARELIHLAVAGLKIDATPFCLTATLSCLPIVNDFPGWESDEHRMQIISPFLPRLLGCHFDFTIDQKITLKLAELAAHIFVPSCPPSVDREALVVSPAKFALEGANAALAMSPLEGMGGCRDTVANSARQTAMAAWGVIYSKAAYKTTRGDTRNWTEEFARAILDTICTAYKV